MSVTSEVTLSVTNPNDQRTKTSDPSTPELAKLRPRVSKSKPAETSDKVECLMKENFRLRMELADSYLKKKPKQALIHINKALEYPSLSAEQKFNLLKKVYKASVKLKNYTQAEKALKDCLELTDQNQQKFWACDKLCKIYLAQEKYNDAEKAGLEALKYESLLIKFGENNPEKAIQEFLAKSFLLLKLSQACLGQNKYQDSITHAKNALNIKRHFQESPFNVFFYISHNKKLFLCIVKSCLVLANENLKKKNYEKAESYAQKGLKYAGTFEDDEKELTRILSHARRRRNSL